MVKPTKQLLYNRTNPKDFYPKNLMQNILDGEGGDNLYVYLSNFNHLNVGEVPDKIYARRRISELFRKRNMYISYSINDSLYTEYFSGTNNEAKIEEYWISDSYWKEYKPSGGSGEIPNFNATVTNVASTDEAIASVMLEEDTFKFSFGIPRGKDGLPGAPGEPGKNGDNAIETRTVFVFKSSETKPNKPVGGHWNSSTNIITAPSGWSVSDSSLSGIIWMSNGVFDETGILVQDWTDPIRITGENGEAGADGKSYEFIYILTKNDYEIPTTPTSEQEDDYVPTGWYDNPRGVSVEFQVEWVSTRNKNNNGIWSNFSTPAIWSKWGVNGKDGDGIEYIYKRTSVSIPPTNPTPSDITTDQYQSKGDYEGIEYIPIGWTDDPIGVDSVNMWEWVCVRKRKNGEWSRFSEPALWAKYGEQGTSGNSIRIMYAKTSGSNDVPVFIENNINPGSIWGSVIPIYSGNEAVWGIQAVVNYKNELVSNWTGPYLITGVNGKDGTLPNYQIYVFKNSATKPNAPTGNNKEPGDGWVDFPTGEGVWWSCVGIVNGVTDLVTSWGEPIKINGQDGAGAVSLSNIKEMYGVSVDSAVPPTQWQEEPVSPTEEYPYAWNKEIIYYSDGSLQETSARIYKEYLTNGDDGRGILNVINYYKLTNTTDAPNINDTGWSTIPLVTTSENKYLWNYEQITYTDNTIEKIEPHICSVHGERGVGIQSIVEEYGLSNNQNTIPDEWSANVKFPTSNNKYAWNREKITDTNGYIDYTSPRIYSVYTEDGKGISDIINYYKVTSENIPPSVEDIDWSTEPVIPTADKPFSWNYEKITYTDGTYIIIPVHSTGSYGVSGIDGVSISDVKEFYGISSAEDIIPTEWSDTQIQPNEEFKYAWNKERIIYDNGNFKDVNPHIYYIWGKEGTDGIGISSINNYYKLMTDNSYIGTPTEQELSTWILDVAPITNEEYPYLYNVEVITFTDGTKTITSARCIGNHAADGATGNHEEWRFKASSIVPAVDYNARVPEGWSTNPPITVESGQKVYIIIGTIDADNNLVGVWRGPTCISGETGPQGADGPAGIPGSPGINGVDGLPGISFINLYSLNSVNWYNDRDDKNLSYEIWSIFKNDIDLENKDLYDLIGFPDFDDITEEDINDIINSVQTLKDNIFDTSLDIETRFGNFCYYLYYVFLYKIDFPIWTDNINNINIDKFLQTLNLPDEIKNYNDGEISYNSYIQNLKKNYCYIMFTQAKVVYTNEGLQFDGDSEWSEPCLLSGVNGIDGNDGSNGVSITNIVDYYKLTETYDAPDITENDSTTPLNPTKNIPYLWVRERISYSNGTYSWSSSSARLLARYSEDGADGVGIKNTITSYAVSSSSTIIPDAWSTNIAVPGNGEYLWTKIEIIYTNDTSNVSYTVLSNGLSAITVERIDEYYGLSNDDKTYPTNWDINPVVPTSNNKYAWNKEITIYSDNTQRESTPHIYALYLNDGIQGEPGETITSIVNYYIWSKTKTIPNTTLSDSDKENVTPSNWTSETSYKIWSKGLPNKYYPYTFNYEVITLSSGTKYSTPPSLIGTYAENGISTINLYIVSLDNSDWDNLFIYQYMLLYYASNPNIKDIDFNYIANESDSTKIEIFNYLSNLQSLVDNEFTDEEKIEYINTVCSYYGSHIDTFSSDLIFIDPDGEIYGAPDYPIFMITANVIISSSGYTFANGTTKWSDPIRINSTNGTNGSNGSNGTGIGNVEVMYCLHTSNTQTPTNGNWQSSVPETTSSYPYIWQRTRYIGTNGSNISVTYNLYTVGKDGTSVSDITEYYCVSSNNNTAPTNGWVTSVPTMTSVNRYLWNYEVFHMSNGSTKETSKRVIGVYGRDGEAVGGVGIKSIDEYYRISIFGPGSTLGTTPPSFTFDESTGTPTDTSWKTTFPTTGLNYVSKYVWNVEVVTYTDNTYYISEPAVIYINVKDGADGAPGKDGADGAPGKDGADGAPGTNGVGISSITNYYLRSSLTSGITTSSSGWTTSILTPTVTERYIWNYEKIIYTNNTSYTSPPHIIAGLGKDGSDGRKGQLIYPAGVYSTSTSYTTDDYKAPYVLDSSDGNFYVLNAKMTWKGTSQNNRTPSQDYATNGGSYWLKFNGFDAVYAKIGIIANGLIGSAVFNGDWMFSQYGINYTGTQTTNYQYFTPSWLTLTKFTSSVTFVPKYAVNLNTGVIYIHGTGTSVNIPSLTIANGSITFCRKSYSSTTNYTTKIINGNIIYHANGSTITTLYLDEATSAVNVLGWCIGNSPSCLLYNTGDSRYYKATPYTGMFDKVNNSSGYSIVVNGIIYKFGTTTVTSFSTWLNSIS